MSDSQGSLLGPGCYLGMLLRLTSNKCEDIRDTNLGWRPKEKGKQPFESEVGSQTVVKSKQELSCQSLRLREATVPFRPEAIEERVVGIQPVTILEFHPKLSTCRGRRTRQTVVVYRQSTVFAKG